MEAFVEPESGETWALDDGVERLSDLWTPRLVRVVEALDRVADLEPVVAL